MRIVAAFVAVVAIARVSAQEARLPLDIYTSWRAERSAVDSAYVLHTEIKPFSPWELRSFGGAVKDTAALRSENARARFSRQSRMLTYPVFMATGGSESGSRGGRVVESYAGAGASLFLKNKFALDVNVVAGYNEPVSYMAQITDSLFAVPGYSYANPQGGYGYHQLTMAMAYRPNRIFEFTAGRGKHFIGEGYRSLFLGDYAPNYNYFRADVNVWRVKYTVLYAQMRATTAYPAAYYPLKNKYATIHYLSLNLSRWWSAGVFEAVVWDSDNNARKREFDINYLNPAIFIRPVEFSIGSEDNSLMGFCSTLRPARGLSLYGQFVMDEMIVSRALSPFYKVLYPDSAVQTGWFVNKHGFQLGAKWHEPLRWKNTTVLAEANTIRPYTYGHANPDQSYTHMAHPLAHPLGANFIEWVGMAVWQPAHFWHFALRGTYSRKGYTNHLYNMGEEPALSSTDRISSTKYAGYFITQGRRVDVANIRLEVGYTLVEAWNLRVETAVHYRWERTSTALRDMTFFTLGLRTALWNDYRDL